MRKFSDSLGLIKSTLFIKLMKMRKSRTEENIRRNIEQIGKDCTIIRDGQSVANIRDENVWATFWKIDIGYIHKLKETRKFNAE